MRIIIKGGVWKNTEDEILKAAVMKYGKNQWARISSLLTRKSPKQCKARWFEWLDPSIKKTEWSKEEDEKLLHLAKLMPTQWRTIAPIVGRTPTQCLERYQKLLDEAEQKEGEDEEDGPSAEDIRKLRPGEIDPDPESKPARPDPVDMDEDEKEMLSEARARLANTQGKKAKRKARERQLEESRRMSSLQKRRELRAAGVGDGVSNKKKRREFNYNLEIPFEIKAPAGFYNVADEKEVSRTESINFRGTFASEVLQRKRTDVEDEQKKQDIVKRKKAQERGLAPELAGQLSKLKQDEIFSKRRKLNLPLPQIGDHELDEIVKLGHTSENARAALVHGENDSSHNLLTDYETSFQTIMGERSTASRTPRTPSAAQDSIQLELQIIKALQNNATPLLGGENALLQQGGTGFMGMTPQRATFATPNLLSMALTPKRGQEFSDTASNASSTMSKLRGGTPLRTPLRDEFGINQGALNYKTSSEQDIEDETDDVRQMKLQKDLEFGFATLPAPKNDFEIVFPDVAEDRESGDAQVRPQEEDMADVQRQLKLQSVQNHQRRLERRSMALKRSLPRSTVSDHNVSSFLDSRRDDAHILNAEKLIAEELIFLLRRDSVEESDPALEIFSDIELKKARNLLENENSSISTDATSQFESQDALIKHMHEARSRASLHWHIESQFGQFVYVYEENARKRTESLKFFESHLDAVRQRASKLSRKMEVALGGYQQRAQNLRRRISETFCSFQALSIDYECYSKLWTSERDVVIPLRLDSLNTQVKALKEHEAAGQATYRALVLSKGGF